MSGGGGIGSGRKMGTSSDGGDSPNFRQLHSIFQGQKFGKNLRIYWRSQRFSSIDSCRIPLGESEWILIHGQKFLALFSKAVILSHWKYTDRLFCVLTIYCWSSLLDCIINWTFFFFFLIVLTLHQVPIYHPELQSVDFGIVRTCCICLSTGSGDCCKCLLISQHHSSSHIWKGLCK